MKSILNSLSATGDDIGLDGTVLWSHIAQVWTVRTCRCPTCRLASSWCWGNYHCSKSQRSSRNIHHPIDLVGIGKYMFTHTRAFLWPPSHSLPPWTKKWFWHCCFFVDYSSVKLFSGLCQNSWSGWRPQIIKTRMCSASLYKWFCSGLDSPFPSAFSMPWGACGAPPEMLLAYFENLESDPESRSYATS